MERRLFQAVVAASIVTGYVSGRLSSVATVAMLGSLLAITVFGALKRKRERERSSMS